MGLKIKQLLKNKFLVFLCILLFLAIGKVYLPWFLESEIIGGDWPYLYNEEVQGTPFLVPSWNTWEGNGLGGTTPAYFIQTYENFTIAASKLFHISWILTYKIFWFGFFVLLSCITSVFLYKFVFQKQHSWGLPFAVFIFLVNTYILMVVGGGEMGFALGYAVCPLVLVLAMKLINLLFAPGRSYQKKLLYTIIFSFVLGVELLLDPRVTYIILLAIFVYYLMNVFTFVKVAGMRKSLFSTLLISFLFLWIIPGIIVVLLHAAWIFPILLYRQGAFQVSSGYTSVQAVTYFSFATFSQAIALLHPYYPENIFGKVTFTKPEYLLLPIVAFSSFLFTKKNNKIIFLFFGLLALLGAFFAKGVNPPFGGIYQFLFSHIPGFIMFRDPTKWYILTVLGFTILIPLTITSCYEWLGTRAYPRILSRKKYPAYVFLSLIVLVLFFLNRDALAHTIQGTFQQHTVPNEYVQLKDFIRHQPKFSRTLWIPTEQRFLYGDDTHPAVGATSLFHVSSPGDVIKALNKPQAAQLLANLSIQYVIVPYDSLGEIFLTDRKYDDGLYQKTKQSVAAIPWLKQVKTFGKIAVFETPFHKNHFWLKQSGSISYKEIDSTKYIVTVDSSGKNILVFSENYSPYWIANIKNITIHTVPDQNGLNEFTILPGKHTYTITFIQQRLYTIGWIVAAATFLLLLLLFFMLQSRTYAKKIS